MKMTPLERRENRIARNQAMREANLLRQIENAKKPKIYLTFQRMNPNGPA